MEILINREEGTNSQLSTELPVKTQTNKPQKHTWPARSARPLNLRWQEPSQSSLQFDSTSVRSFSNIRSSLSTRKQKFKTWALRLTLTSQCTIHIHATPFTPEKAKQELSDPLSSRAIHPWFLTCYNSCPGLWMVSKLVNVTGQDRLPQIRLLNSLIWSLNSARKG